MKIIFTIELLAVIAIAISGLWIPDHEARLTFFGCGAIALAATILWGLCAWRECVCQKCKAKARAG